MVGVLLDADVIGAVDLPFAVVGDGDQQIAGNADRLDRLGNEIEFDQNDDIGVLIAAVLAAVDPEHHDREVGFTLPDAVRPGSPRSVPASASSRITSNDDISSSLASASAPRHWLRSPVAERH